MTAVLNGTPVRLTVNGPNQVALDMTGRDYLSWSQISMMQRCPRAFAFQYVEKAKPEFVSSSLLFGGAIHSAIEAYLQAQLEGEPLTHQDLLDTYQESWANEASDDIPVKFNKSETIATLDDLAGRMLKAFLSSPPSYGSVVGIELPVRLTLHQELPDLFGRIDAVYLDQGLHVVDFKTSRSRWSVEKAEESAAQLLLYAKAVQNQFGDDEHVRAHFTVLTKAKMPAVQNFEVKAGQSRIEATIGIVKRVWAAMLAGVDYPAPSPMNCASCAFKSQCPAFSG